MRFRFRPFRAVGHCLGTAAFLVLTALAPAPASAQQGQTNPGFVLVFPTGDRATGSLLVEVAAPAEVPVGQRYDYKIKVTNVAKNLVLENVTLHQSKVEGFSIESSEPKFEDGDKGEMGWKIGKLAPGESKMITVSAQSDKEGNAAGCLTADFQAALCMTTKFVRPALKVTKQAPEKANICDLLTYTYTVQNTGSGAARGIKLTDELPTGLTTEKGEKSLSYDVGDLEPGQSREYSVKLMASRVGDFASRATAAGQNDLKANSNRPNTAIRQAKLTVNVAGPSTMYVNQPMTYRVELTNEGGAAARVTRLQINADRVAKLIRVSKTDPGDAEPQISANTMTWDLGTVEPGEKIAASFTVIGRTESELKHVATAASACGRGGDVAKAATATVAVETRVMTFPALLLSLVDRVDPVMVGNDEIYRVTVLNQGSGPDQNVKMICTIPEEFTFVEAQGDNPANADGQALTLGPIEKLAPGERAVWDVQVRAKKPGDVRMKVELSSDYLDESNPAISIEPTRIIGTDEKDKKAAVQRNSSDDAREKEQAKSKDAQKKEQAKPADNPNEKPKSDGK
jgi:uncharacterized repeat protein (TIGR01451 family)